MNRLRWCTRCGLLVTGCWLLILGRSSEWPVVVPAASPFVTASAVLTTHHVAWYSWIGISVLVLVTWRHRLFCRWMCPTGFCADQATWMGRRAGRKRPHAPAVGPWIVLLTLVGACLGYPLLLWLDPLAMLSASVSCVSGPITASWWLGCGIVLVLLVSLLWPNLWCSKFCPLGGLQDVADGMKRLAWNAVRGGPPAGTAIVGSQRAMRRRTMLSVTFGIVWAAATRKWRDQTCGPLRPPGALDESRFTGVCIRCGNCTRACPAHIIHQHTDPDTLAGLLTPSVAFQEDYCWETCNRCTLVCPSGALGRVALDAKPTARMGVPHIDMDVCLLGDDRECSICRNRCPYEAIRLEFSEEFYTLTPRVDLQRCPGCGACQVACPTQPVKAIVVLPS